MGEIKGNLADRAKAKASMGRDDRAKGKPVGRVTSPPAPGKKKLEDRGGKRQLVPHAKPQTQSVAIKSVEVKGKTSVYSSTKTFTKTTTTTAAVKVYTREAKLKIQAFAIQSVEVKGKTSVYSSTKAFTKTTKETTMVRVKA